ncbi:hypothetical protein DLAC_02749 [Tieghemostelium lacteum]|uniref:Uncharacterized protein n=1 Tax=Tieghemostelium lacteum TaxID=361077 RepID=A0A152A3C2_TIELA|nr:hypothetical protein DLAC_02749 [Tieghemostelium lacteum]|eukprot:KYR00709.1 hypothetical protein DLAC_02749 [Tieghemostelium lacteum]
MDDLNDFFAKKDSSKTKAKKVAPVKPAIVVVEKPVATVVDSKESPNLQPTKQKTVVDLSAINKQKETNADKEKEKEKTEQIVLPTMKWADKAQHKENQEQSKAKKDDKKDDKHKQTVDESQSYGDKVIEEEEEQEDTNNSSTSSKSKKVAQKQKPKAKKKTKQELEAESLMAQLGITEDDSKSKPKKK